MKNSLVMDLAQSLGLADAYLANQGAVDAVTDVLKEQSIEDATQKPNVNRSFSNYKQGLFMQAASPQHIVGGV
jgi:hypothetical protein